MNKKESQELTDDMLLTDALLQIKTIKDLLIAKHVFTEDEFLNTMDNIAKSIAKSILQKAQVQGDLDQLIDSLHKSPKREQN